VADIPGFAQSVGHASGGGIAKLTFFLVAAIAAFKKSLTETAL
jgi:hypothetical protein